jgi:tetratricopeptide (TPR) repeat protein
VEDLRETPFWDRYFAIVEILAGVEDAALDAIYEDMAWVARKTSQYAKVIALHDSANAVAGVNHGGSQYLKCFAYSKLHHFQEAVEECTHLIDTQRDVSDARYTRAQSYEGLKKYDAALADFAPIAEDGSDNYVRWGAVIEMGHIRVAHCNRLMI